MSNGPPFLSGFESADFTSDDVESRVQADMSMGSKPRLGALGQSALLPGVDGQFGRPRALRASGFDLDKSEHRATADNEVELDAARPDVSIEDAISSAPQEVEGLLLARVAEGQMQSRA